jgi:hypothetical protein
MVDRSTAPSVQIVTTVAEATDVDPLDLEPPLYRVVDVDALDRLLDPESERERERGRSLTVTFEYAGYEVTATSDGTVDVE